MNDSEDYSTLEYYFNGLENLTQFLQVVEDISTETGMSDWIMTHRGIRMAYCWQDAKAVIKGAKRRTSGATGCRKAFRIKNKKIYFFGRRTLPHKCPAFLCPFRPVCYRLPLPQKDEHHDRR